MPGEGRRRPGGGRARHVRGDDGFVLLESIIAIALITVLMVALTSLFISAMQGTAHQRGTQSAIRVATDEIDQARGLSYAGALSGRDQASVLAQFDAAPASVRAWLSGRGDQAYSAAASLNAGRTQCAEGVTANCAQLPTRPVTRTMGSTDFDISYYEEWCYRNAADKSDGACVAKTSQQGGTSYNQYLRVVVAIAWTDSTCPTGGCSYLGSLLLNGTAEPTFYFNDQPPPKPNITSCSPDPVAIGDVLSTEDPANPALDIVGTNGFCAFSGGVPTFTWSATGLPAGLGVTAAGQITGTVADSAVTVSGAKISVTDAFLITGSSPAFGWTVLPRLVIGGASDQKGIVGTAIAGLTLTATGGAGVPYGWTTTGLPSGLTATMSGSGNTQLKISGTPSSAGASTVSVTLNDKTTRRTVTVTFAWTVYPKLVVTVPPSQASTVNQAITAVPLPVTGGSGSYTLTATGGALPAGLSLQGSVATGYRIAGTPTATGTKTVTYKVDDPTSGQSQTFSISWGVYARPTINNVTDQTTGTQRVTQVQVIATCANSPCTYRATGLPPGLAIDPVSGQIAGTTGASTGSYTVVVTATDPAGAAVSTPPFVWKVVPRPYLKPIPNQTWYVGDSPAGLIASVTCPNGGCTFAASSLPAGVTFKPDTGAFGSTITGSGSGTTTVTVTDTIGQQDTTTFGWRVYALPTVSAPTRAGSGAGRSVSVAVPSTCDNGGCTFSASGLPSGLSIGTTSGTISGSAPATGSYPVTVTIKDAGGRTGSATFTWRVTPLPSVAGGDQQNTTTAAVSVNPFTCPSGSCTYSATGLPGGLSVKADGTISGTITASDDDYPVTLTVTDSWGNAVTASITWTVNALPTLVIPKQFSQNGKSVLVDLSNFVDDGTGPFTFSSSSAFPSGLTLNSDGTVTGTVGDTNKTYVGIVVTVKDANNRTASGTFDWTVQSSSAVSMGSIPYQTTTRGNAVSLNVYGKAAGGTTPYKFSFVGTFPPGLSIDQDTGVITGSPTGSAKTYRNLYIRVTDVNGVSGQSAKFQWTVR